MYSGIKCYLACRGVQTTPSCSENYAMHVAVIDVAIAAILAAAATLAILAMNGVGLGVLSDLVELNWRGVTVLLSVSVGILLADGIAYSSITTKTNAPPTSDRKGEVKPGENHVLRPATGWEVLKPKIVARAVAKAESTLVNSKVTMTSFNVGMLPGWVNSAQRIGSAIARVFTTSDQYLASPSERAPKVAARLLARGDPIVSIQELFCPSATTILTNDMQENYHIVHRVEDKSASFMERGFINSGLFFATLYPIEEEGIKFHKFTNLGAEDAGADKGLLRVPVLHPAKKMIVYSTHLQAKSGEKYTQIRKDQLESIVRIIAEDQQKNPDVPIFLLGDLNVSYSDLKGQKCPEGSCLESSFFAHFHDLYLTDHNQRGERTNGSARYLEEDMATTDLGEPTGSFYNMLTGDGQEEPHRRYDFCLLFKTKDTPPSDVHTELCREEHSAFSPRLLSDHLSLRTTVDVNAL
jgi:hypothetical protein